MSVHNFADIFSFVDQICHVSKYCFSAQKYLPCCSIIFAFTTSALLGTRLVITALALYGKRYPLGIILTLHLLKTKYEEFLQLGAARIASNVPIPSVDDLADQVADVLNFFG